VRRGARWALGVGASLIAMAAIGGACADVRSVDLDDCSAICLPAAADDAAASEDNPAADIILSLSGDGGTAGAGDARPDLMFNAKDLPTVLVDGLPSAIADVAAQTADGEGVSPYAFFAEVIAVSYSVDARAAPFFLSTPSLTSRLRDFLWASNDFFGRSSGDTASRRSLPVSVDAEYLTGRLTTGWTTRTRAAPTLNSSPASGPPSSSAIDPFGQVGDEAGRSAEFSSDGAESNK
jgi:hypothetical protein